MAERFKKRKFEKSRKYIRAAALVVPLGIAACGGSSQDILHEIGLPPGTKRIVYLPSWFNGRQLANFANAAPGQIEELDLAFAEPNAGGGITAPNINPSQLNIIKKIEDGSHPPKEVLSVGGWGTNAAEHQHLLSYWAAALQNPQATATSIAKAVETVEATTGTHISGVDLDIEYPTPDQAQQVEELVTSVRSTLPNHTISMAVPAVPPQESVYTKSLVQKLDGVDVMTYDEHTPKDGSDIAGPIATGQWTLNALKNWVSLAGTKKIAVGEPTYGYLYDGAKNLGDHFTSGREVYPPTGNTVHEDTNQLTSTAQESGDIETFISPRMAWHIYGQAVLKYSGINQIFYWDAKGINKDYLKKNNS